MAEKIRSILAAIDFSEPSLNALETAVALALTCSASLTIAHVHERISGVDLAAVDTNKGQQASDILNALANDIYQKHQLYARLIREDGCPSHGIVRQAMTGFTDLIVMGTYGGSGYREGFIGTTAYNTIKLSACPVLIIPGGRKWVPFKKILMPVRPGIAQRPQLGIINQFAAPAAVVETLSLYPGERALVKQEEELFQGLAGYPEGQVRNIPVISRESQLPENVLAHAEQHESDLIVLLPSVDVSTRQNFIGPYSQRILHQSKIPVLSLSKPL